jgi:hypothetical protein
LQGALTQEGILLSILLIEIIHGRLKYKAMKIIEGKWVIKGYTCKVIFKPNIRQQRN